MSTRTMFNDILTGKGFFWVIDEPRLRDADTDRDYFLAIIHTIDNSFAPTSETSLLGDALHDDGYDDDPASCLAWWLDAYRAWELAGEERQDEVYEAITSGDSAYALSLVSS